MKKTIDYKHGTISYLDNDVYTGKALSLYGEREEQEVQFVLSLVKEGDVVIDVGANIGTLTLPLAKKATVHAFEPQGRMFELLQENVQQNHLPVECHQFGLGEAFGKAALPPIDYDAENNFGGVSLYAGSDIKVATLDSFNLERCELIKIDVEGMEAQVLKGAKATIEKFKPLLYVENDRLDKSAALIDLIRSYGYEMYWHTPPLFNPDNVNGVSENIFPGVITVNMLCVPQGRACAQIAGLRRVTSKFDRESGRALLPPDVKPANGWAGVARFGGIGDNLIAAAAVYALKRKGFKVEMITSTAAQWTVYQHNPNIDKLSVKTNFELPQMGTIEWQKWFKGRSEEYDVFAHMSHSCEGTMAFFQCMSQFHWPAHVRRRIANKSYLEMQCDLAGCDYVFGPLFYASPEERTKALETKAKVGERCISIVMSGSRIDKLHPRLPALVIRLLNELNAPVVLLGDPQNFEHARAIEKCVIDTNGTSKGLHVAISSAPDVEGKRAIDWPVRRTLSFALVSDLVIGPDTGIMWGVAMEDMPKVMLLGHASAENITKHWVNTETLHADQSVPCWPCHQLHDDPPGGPPPGFHSFCTPNTDNSGAACISSISIEKIVQVARVHWERKSEPQKEVAHG
jgi:FkbM family methyltransferase